MSDPTASKLWPACLSALQLDRLLLGEAAEGEAASLRAHLAGCARCSAALDELRADRDRTQLPSLRVVPFPAQARAQGSEEPAPAEGASGPAGARPLRRLPRRALAAAAGLAAAAALALWVRAPAPAERIKGSGLGLSMFVQHGGEVRRAAPGEAVAPGDAIRFAVTTPAPAYVAVLSRDPLGRGSVYFPLGARAEPVAAGAEVALPLGTRLDATAGEERLYGLFCASPVELEPLRAALGRGDAQVPDGCQVIQWSFVKRP